MIGLLGEGRTQEGNMSEIVVLKAHKTNKVLPPGYSLDPDPDVVILRRAGGFVVAYFPMWGFPPLLALEETEIGPRAGRGRVGGGIGPAPGGRGGLGWS